MKDTQRRNWEQIIQQEIMTFSVRNKTCHFLLFYCGAISQMWEIYLPLKTTGDVHSGVKKTRFWDCFYLKDTFNVHFEKLLWVFFFFYFFFHSSLWKLWSSITGDYIDNSLKLHIWLIFSFLHIFLYLFCLNI